MKKFHEIQKTTFGGGLILTYVGLLHVRTIPHTCNIGRRGLSNYIVLYIYGIPIYLTIFSPKRIRVMYDLTHAPLCYLFVASGIKITGKVCCIS